MSDLLERVARMHAPTMQRDQSAREALKLSEAERCNPRLARIYFTELSELPDAVKMHPPAAQRAFMVTFNNWLRRYGDQAKAFRAAQKALRTKVSQLKAMKKRGTRPGIDEALIRWNVKRALQGPQTQIVVNR